VIVLSGHAHGDQVRYSEIFAAVRARGLSVERTAEVLAHLDLLNDDRQASFERWLQQSLHQLAPGICRDVEAWLRTLHDGGPRTRLRSPDTVWGYARWVKPALLEWSARYDHLREVTREDVLAALKARHGWEHASTLSALRSLFRCCKRRGVIFGDPTSRIHLGRHPTGMILPLAPGDIAEAVAAATTPAARLLLALAAVHATRRKAMRELRLDDVDLGGRRLTIAGRVRPLDDPTRRAILDWLAYRRQRWPNTANPHLLINQQTAMETGTVSTVWTNQTVRGLTATLERLRVDRQLDEALTHGPDPLHLAVVFGLDEQTAIRYATAARQLLESAVERQPATEP
jgi:site-specific recombinase XerD